MEKTGRAPRLIIVCGLPGSGKTTLARVLEEKLGAVRLSPDEWMEALALDLYDEERRGQIEALQWKLGRELLAAPADVLFDRLRRRARENPPIDRDAVSRWFEIFQPPTPEEMALFDEPLIAAIE